MLELYKRFRPKTLDNIVGNEETVSSLKRMLEKKSLPHSILLHGESGCGKTTIGRILRRELGCGLLDFKEYNMSDDRGIDAVREISRTMTMSPAGGKCRIYLLDEVHQLTKQGQNAALKILEDTPRHVYFILCTTDPQKLIPTVRKRCTPFVVELLKPEDMSRLIKRVCKKAEIKLSEDHRDDLIEAAEGSARTALVLLDKVSHLPTASRGKALKQRLHEQEEVIALCRALLAKEPWSNICRIIKALGTEIDVEKVRWAVMGYAAAVIGSGKKSEQAYIMLRAFEHHFFDSKKNGLMRACYEVTT